MKRIIELFPRLTGFQWDKGNAEKNFARHGVTQVEAEQVFLNRPLVTASPKVRDSEARYVALGRTTAGKSLFVVFTIREDLVRIISARPMSRRERVSHDTEKGT